MIKNKGAFAIGAVFILGFVLLQSTFIVDQTEKAIVVELGKPVGDTRGPGLHFKKPFIQKAIHFDARIRDYDAKPAEILTEDKKTMIVDNYTKWRIVDPLQFYRTVRTDSGAIARLDDIIYSQLRAALGNYTLIEVVNQKRQEIMAQVTETSSELIKEFGIEVVDVRIKRTDLPIENEKAIFGRMRAERERQAKQYRSEGREEGVKIKSGADRDRVLIIADAQRKAAVLQGEGDAEATRIYNEALTRSPDFYDFKRSLEAYETSFKGNTRILLTPDDTFLRHMQ